MLVSALFLSLFQSLIGEKFPQDGKNCAVKRGIILYSTVYSLEKPDVLPL